MLNIDNGTTELLQGHRDIIICLDISENLFLSGAKDNEIRLWSFQPQNPKQLVSCIAIFKGHN